MGAVLTYIVGIVTCALPGRYREVRAIRETVSCAVGMLSGIVQFQVFMCISILRYLDFVQTQVGFLGRTVIDGGRENALTAQPIQYGMGFMASAEYLLHPLSLLLLYMAFEGIIRTLAALAIGQPLPTLPLFVIGWAHTQIDCWRARRALGPLVSDEIEFGDGTVFDLRVSSCRPKDWNSLVTVRFQGEFYRMFKQEVGNHHRQFVYHLRKNPIGWLVVVIREYQPEDVVRQ